MRQAILVEDLNGTLFIISLQHFQGLFNESPAEILFLISREGGITNRIRNGNAGQDPVDADHLSDVRYSGDLNGRNTNFFDLSCNR